MKKLMNKAVFFAIYGLCAGVYYRELTKACGFTSRTALGMAHPHILMLGLVGMLLTALFVKTLHIDYKKIKVPVAIYNCGLLLASAMMLLRGSFEVLGKELSASAAVSGMAGLGHIAVATGIVWLLFAFKKAA